MLNGCWHSLPSPAQQCPRCARALTRREWQVLTLLRCQQSVGDIARHLGLSPKTVYTYKRCTMHKLGFTVTPSCITG